MYTLIQSTAVIDEKPTVVYGMQYCDHTFPHISESKDAVLAIIELCNQYDVDPVHAEDVAEDYLHS